MYEQILIYLPSAQELIERPGRNQKPAPGVIARCLWPHVLPANLDTFFPHSLLCRFRPVIGLLSITYVLAINLAEVPGVMVRRLPVCRPARGGEELHWRETCD